MGKEDKEENGILDTMGDALSAVGKTLFDRGLSKKGLEEKAKDKPKKVPNKPKDKPKKVSERTQRADSPSGFSFSSFMETDNRTKEMKEQPSTPINTGLTRAEKANLRIQKRIDALKKRQKENN